MEETPTVCVVIVQKYTVRKDFIEIYSVDSIEEYQETNIFSENKMNCDRKEGCI
jgi:hypothetical protein